MDDGQAHRELRVSARALLDALKEVDEAERLDPNKTSKKYVTDMRRKARAKVGPARRALSAAVVRLEQHEKEKLGTCPGCGHLNDHKVCKPIHIARTRPDGSYE